MNSKIFLPIAAVAAMAALTGCDENAWNDKLDGFDDEFAPKQEATLEYTINANDYKELAANSANKALSEKEGLVKDLAAVNSKQSFPASINPREYISNYLNSSKSPVFYYTDGSSVKLTYNVQSGLPECVNASAAAELYTVSEADYVNVWESDDNFVPGFAPSHPAAKALPGILKAAYPDAQKGQYVIATYNESAQEPVFGNVGGSETPEFPLTSVVGGIKADDEVVINGVVTGNCTNGFTLTDNSGTIFVYMGGGFDTTTYPVGTQMTLVGTASSYKGNLQVAKGAEIDVVGTQAYTYPAPVNYTAADLDATLDRAADATAIYCTMSGKVVASGNYFNLILSDDAKAQGSIYGADDELKSKLSDGQMVTISGWYISISSGKFCNIVVTNVTPQKSNAPVYRAPAVEVPMQAVNAVYAFDGSKWAVPANFCVLSHADYQAMNQKYDNLTAPADYLPNYLRANYPYAMADDVKYVLYKLYAGGSTNYVCDMYTFDGSVWSLNKGIATETAQYVRTGGKWIYDPNVTITLPAGKGIEISTLYYQTCVDWVKANVANGDKYVSSYGNNEYYCGTSAYQGNVDLRAGSAKAQYADGWAGMSDDEIVATMKTRFTNEVLPAALSILNADAAPMEGLDVIYTVNFAWYDGKTTNTDSVKYKVVSTGKFEFIECSWDK